MSQIRFFRVLLFGAAVAMIHVNAHAENKRAKDAAKAYNAALAKARKAYASELELAIKEEGGAGNLTEANRLKEVKTSIETEGKIGPNDAISVATRKLENTVWGTTKNKKGFLRLLRRNRTMNHLKVGGVWIVSDKTTAILQSGSSGNIYVMKFNEKLTGAAVHKFQAVDEKPARFYRKSKRR